MKDYHGEITEKFIKKLHILIMTNLREGPGGKFRTTDRGIPGVNHPPWGEVPERLEELLQWYNDKKESNLHPLELASRFHQGFEEIHPFHDGNGRTGRAILDYMLRSNDYPTIYIPTKQQHHYHIALRMGNIL